MSQQPRQATGLSRSLTTRSAISRGWSGGRRSGWISALLLVCSLMGLLTACAAPTLPSDGAGGKAPTATPNVQATASAQPVLIQLGATPSGTIAADSLEISVETTVTNQTGQAISLAHYAAVICLPDPPLVFSLIDGAKKTAWQETQSDSCPFGPVYDVTTIPAGGSKQWTTLLDLRYDLAHGATILSPGTYTLLAAGLLWHQGTISATGDTTSAHGYASGQTLIILR